MARGNAAKNIVDDGEERQRLIDDLARTVARSDWKLLTCAAWPVPSSPTHCRPKLRFWPLSTPTAIATTLRVMLEFDPDDLAAPR